MKKLLSILLIVLIIALSGCQTLYSKTDYKHLSNENNYTNYIVKYSHLQSVNNNEKDVLIHISFQSISEANEFSSIKISDSANPDNYTFAFTLHGKNNEILKQTDFYETIKKGDLITIKASNYKDLSSNKYMFIAEISYYNKTYLKLNMGMKNIIAHLEAHKSPFLK